MLTNKSNIYSFNYDIDFSEPINLFFSLINGIAKATIPSFTVNSLFSEEFTNKIGLNTSTNFTYEELSYTVTQYYNREILNIINLRNTNILYIYKIQKILISFERSESENDALKKTLINLIREAKIFDILLSEIESEELKTSLSSLKFVKFAIELFTSVVKLTGRTNVIVPYMSFDFFILNKIDDDVFDKNDFYINKAKFAEKFKLGIDDQSEVKVITLRDSEPVKEIGVRYGDIFFPLQFPIDEFLNEASLLDYYWLLFRTVYQEPVTPRFGSSVNKESLNSFKAELRKKSFIYLLSHLEKNHSIKEVKINEEKHKSYFDIATKVNNLKDIESFDFYITNVQGSTALGIYVNEKIGTSYNLLHWLKNENKVNTLSHYRTVNPKQLKIEERFVLKPEFAFYFIESFFEDFFEQALKDKSKDYIRNFKLSTEKEVIGEFDFLIKNEHKLIFIEVKTKLTDNYIEKYINTCSNLLDQLKNVSDKFEIEFYIFSAFSDSTCLAKQYFIEKARKRTSYNVPRNGLNSIPYYFTVPIAKHPHFVLTCIAEPEFTRLKNLVKKLL